MAASAPKGATKAACFRELESDQNQHAFANRLFLQGMANGILGFADFALGLTGNLFCGAFHFGPFIPCHFSDGFLHGALDLLAGASNAILVHRSLLLVDRLAQNQAAADKSRAPREVNKREKY